MGWIITHDHLEHKDVCIVGPSNISDADEARLKAGEGFEFRMLDDDGELYYTGRSLEDNSFDPKDDFGEPDSGCTEIQYKDRRGVWTPL